MNDGRPQSKFAAMTPNERLFVAGTLKAFDAAARKRDRSLMISLLEQVDFTNEQAQKSVDQMLANPTKYGF